MDKVMNGNRAEMWADVNKVCTEQSVEGAKLSEDGQVLTTSASLSLLLTVLSTLSLCFPPTSLPI